MTTTFVDAENNVVNPFKRIKVRIRCEVCGETFHLRGVRNKDGELETGFKSCTCGNTESLEITPVDQM